MKVAVIGAGAAGLVSARELNRDGHRVTVFEQSGQVGGIWVYQAETEDDLLGLSPSAPVFSSLYDSLRTNLPRDLMAFLDYTFDSKGGGEDHWQRYPHHSKVLTYLERFAESFGILPLIRFREEVAGLTPDGVRWNIATSTGRVEVFDAVVVCNGHYSTARVPDLRGISDFRGLTMHSHNYRNPEVFKDKRVAVLGTAASGADIVREVAGVAESVYWCGNIFSLPPLITPRGVHLYPKPSGFNGNDLEFSDGTEVRDIDIFLFCTGYEYRFDFLEADVVQVTDNWAHPLYLDIVAPEFPSLAFIGLPFLVIPFPLFEMQAKWFSRVLAGSVVLPSKNKMKQLVSAREAELHQQKIKTRHFHKLGEKQTDYVNQLALACGEPKMPDWFGKLALEAQRSRLADPEHFRDKPMQFRGPTIIKEM